MGKNKQPDPATRASKIMDTVMQMLSEDPELNAITMIATLKLINIGLEMMILEIEERINTKDNEMTEKQIETQGISSSFMYGDNEDMDAVMDAIMAVIRTLNNAKLTPLAYNVALTTISAMAEDMEAAADWM